MKERAEKQEKIKIYILLNKKKLNKTNKTIKLLLR